MTPRRPVLDPERDLAGATAEKLARALFRRDKPLQKPSKPQPARGRVNPPKPPIKHRGRVEKRHAPSPRGETRQARD